MHFQICHYVCVGFYTDIDIQNFPFKPFPMLCCHSKVAVRVSVRASLWACGYVCRRASWKHGWWVKGCRGCRADKQSYVNLPKDRTSFYSHKQCVCVFSYVYQNLTEEKCIPLLLKFADYRRGCKTFHMFNVQKIPFHPRTGSSEGRLEKTMYQYQGPGPATRALRAGGRWLIGFFTRGLSAWATSASPGGQVTALAAHPTQRCWPSKWGGVWRGPRMLPLLFPGPPFENRGSQTDIRFKLIPTSSMHIFSL